MIVVPTLLPPNCRNQPPPVFMIAVMIGQRLADEQRVRQAVRGVGELYLGGETGEHPPRQGGIICVSFIRARLVAENVSGLRVVG